mgnify:CR=1 FL=1
MDHGGIISLFEVAGVSEGASADPLAPSAEERNSADVREIIYI